MVNLYVVMIKNGRKTIDDVPPMWRDAVQAELDRLAAAEAE